MPGSTAFQPSLPEFNLPPETLVGVDVPESVQDVFTRVLGREPEVVELQRLVWLKDELKEKLDLENPWGQIEEVIKFQLDPQARHPVSYIRTTLLNAGVEKPESTKPGGQSKGNAGKASGDGSRSLALKGEGEGDLQVAGLPLQRPKERKGYTIPAEENQRNLVDFASEFLNQDGVDNPPPEEGPVIDV